MTRFSTENTAMTAAAHCAADRCACRKVNSTLILDAMILASIFVALLRLPVILISLINLLGILALVRCPAKRCLKDLRPTAA